MNTGTLVMLVLAAYVVPWLVAILRKRPDSVAICALNLLLGWTLIGWVIALIWALMPVKSKTG